MSIARQERRGATRCAALSLYLAILLRSLAQICDIRLHATLTATADPSSIDTSLMSSGLYKTFLRSIRQVRQSLFDSLKSVERDCY